MRTCEFWTFRVSFHPLICKKCGSCCVALLPEMASYGSTIVYGGYSKRTQLAEKEKLFMKPTQPLRLTASVKRQHRNVSLVQMFFPTSEKSMCKDEEKKLSAIKHREASIRRHLFSLQLLVILNPTAFSFFLSFFIFFPETPKSNCSRIPGPWQWGGRRDCTSQAINNCDYIAILLPRPLREGASISVPPTGWFFFCLFVF